jgi:hypothetical protein
MIAALPRVAGVCLAFLVIALGSCAPVGSAGSPGASSALGEIRGVVTAGPVCPVERQPPASACADRAVEAARIRIDDAAGRTVTVAVSGADGSFVVSVAPGSYRLVPQPVNGLLGTAAEQQVTVKAAAIAEVDVSYDTGIR